jgi:hypothetical protein
MRFYLEKNEKRFKEKGGLTIYGIQKWINN